MRPNAEMMVLLRDVAARRSTSTTLVHRQPDADEVRQLFDFLEFRTLLRPPGRGARRRLVGTPTPAAVVREVLEAEVHRRSPIADGRGGLTGAGRRHRRCRSPARAGRRGPHRRSRASRSSPIAPRPRSLWIPAAALSRPDVRAALAVLVGPGGVRSRPRRQGARARAARRRSTSTCAAWRSTPRSPPTCSTRPRPATPARGRWSTATPTPASAAPTARPLQRASSTSAATTVDVRRAGARARSPSTASSRRSAALDAPRAAPRCTTPSRSRSSRVLARMEHVGVGVDVAELRRPERPPHRRVRASCGGDHARSPATTFNVNSTDRSCARSSSTELGLAPQQEDQDRLLHRRGVAREAAAASTRIIEHAAALPRGREAALHLRRRACSPRSPPTGASTPRSTRPSPAPAGCQLRPAQPPQHPGALATRVGCSARRSCPARAPSCWSPTTTRSSCAASPTSPRTPG